MTVTVTQRGARRGKAGHGGTLRANRHRFISFNERIASFKIDPIRRTHDNVNLDAADSPEYSFFSYHLNEWADRNLSEEYTTFRRTVEPLCQSLPQLLHHKQTIFDLLIASISKADDLSLEPLLSLLGHFAHDLAVRFEPYFPRALTVVSSLASRHSSIDVIEWSFACIAWLFKFLSRLLTPNLGPLIRLLAPLLGKEVQKPHTVKFTAEALAFLFRRCAVCYKRDPNPLEKAINALLEQLGTEEQAKGTVSQGSPGIEDGVAMLLSESIKGIERKLNPAGGVIYQVWLESIETQDAILQCRLQRVLYKVTTALINHVDADGINPLISTISMITLRQELDCNVAFHRTLSRLLFLLSVVRRGSRINDWKNLANLTAHLLRIIRRRSLEATAELLKPIAIICVTAPLDATLPLLAITVETLKDAMYGSLFLAFGVSFSELNQLKFNELLLSDYSRFLITRWQDFVPQTILSLSYTISPVSERKPAATVDMQLLLQDKLSEGRETKDPSILFGLLEGLDRLSLPKAFLDQIFEHLGTQLADLFQSKEIETNDHLMFGPVLRSWANRSTGGAIKLSWSNIFKFLDRFATLPSYLDAIRMLLENHMIDNLLEIHKDDLKPLHTNICSSKSSLRLRSLEIMRLLYRNESVESREILDTACTIERGPMDFDNSRFILLQMRKLAAQYSKIADNIHLGLVIANFCLGLLTNKFAPVKQEAIEVIKKVCASEQGMKHISELIFDWLSEGPTITSSGGPPKLTSTSRNLVFAEYYSPDVIRIDEIMAHHSFDNAVCLRRLEERYADAISLLDAKVPEASGLALLVFEAVPYLAERNSKAFVPCFLSWADISVQQEAELPFTDFSSLDEQDLSPGLWKEADRKTMLKTMGQFTNPRALFLSADVERSIRNLLHHGDAETQRLALKCLLTWKTPILRSNDEHLLSLLDDSKFRDQLSIFVTIFDNYDENVQDDHALLLRVLVGLLYGRTINRGRQTKLQGQESRRKAVLSAIATFGDTAIDEFLSIGLNTFRASSLLSDKKIEDFGASTDIVSPRRQLGILNMYRHMLETLGNRLERFKDDFLRVMLHCFKRADQSLLINSDDWTSDSVSSPQTIRKAIRQASLHCINLVYVKFVPESIKDYTPSIYSVILSPRLARIAIESAQSVSGYLKLLATLATRLETVSSFTELDDRVLRSVTNCLLSEFCKAEVKEFVMSKILLQVLVTLESEVDEVSIPEKQLLQQRILAPDADYVLRSLGEFLDAKQTRETLSIGIEVVSKYSTMIQNTKAAPSLIHVALKLLKHPAYLVSPKSKGQLVRILKNCIPIASKAIDSDTLDTLTETLSSLFSYFKDRDNRLELCYALKALATIKSDLENVAVLCEKLNSYSSRTLDQPDFDLRLDGFRELNESLYRTLSAEQWRPLIANMLFFAKDEDEMAIRSHAVFALQNFIKSSVNKRAHTDLLGRVLLPALKRGADERSEAIRVEFVTLMGHVVRDHVELPEIKDLVPLLANNDEEASFFLNILHIQQHRRLRAMRRLAVEGKAGVFRSSNVAHFLIPLIEHFIFNKVEGDVAQNLSGEATITIGALSSGLEWPQFRALLHRYACTLQRNQEEHEKPLIKIIDTLITAFGSADVTSVLAKTQPQEQKFVDDITKNVLPIFMAYLHKKDESFVSLRIMVAVVITRLLKILPDDHLAQHLPPMLTDLCGILRSRSQEARDMTRRTLAEIAVLVGPAYFGFLLQELRGALTRGSQLHVLGYTLHSLLLEAGFKYGLGDLDYCLSNIGAILMDDIFGVIGQEKDAEEYTSKMREVKSSKSFDSMEQIASLTTMTHFQQLLRPLNAQLDGKIDLKSLRKVDELMRRILLGAAKNDDFKGPRALVLCYELLQQAYQRDSSTHEGPVTQVLDKARYMVNLNAAKRSTNRGKTTARAYKMIRFALDLVRGTLHRDETLRTAHHTTAFIPLIGEALIHAQEEVQIAAVRLLASMTTISSEKLKENSRAYVIECVKIVRNTVATNSEACQAAIKLVSAILRDQRDTEIRDSDLAFLLKKLKPDLEEPGLQGSAFNFLKALMTRRIMLPELYESLDFVGTIMVTHPSKNTRDMARSAYFQFFMDYPQSQDRFAKQIAFLSLNLDYQYPDGRKSVMETVHLLLSKLYQEPLMQVMTALFLPLVMLLVNDEDSACREMSNALLRIIFERADEDRTRNFLNMVRSWLEEENNFLLKRAAFQVYGIFVDASESLSSRDCQVLLQASVPLLDHYLHGDLQSDFELTFYLLQTFNKICDKHRSLGFAASSSDLWDRIRRCLDFPHTWIKLSSAKLLGLLFADFARSNVESERANLPLVGSGGLQLTSIDVVHYVDGCLRHLQAPDLSEQLGGQTARNLIFLAKISMQAKLLRGTAHTEMVLEQRRDTDSEGEAERTAPAFKDRPLATHIISRVCKSMRQAPATTRAASLVPLETSIQLLAVLMSHMSPEQIQDLLTMILRPLLNLTDAKIAAPFSTDNAFNERYQKLTGHATEILTKIQEKVGMTEYIQARHDAQQRVKNRRQGRLAKRAFERVADPEKAQREKRKKFEKKREKRKERGQEERAKRLAV